MEDYKRGIFEHFEEAYKNYEHWMEVCCGKNHTQNDIAHRDIAYGKYYELAELIVDIYLDKECIDWIVNEKKHSCKDVGRLLGEADYIFDMIQGH